MVASAPSSPNIPLWPALSWQSAAQEKWTTELLDEEVYGYADDLVYMTGQLVGAVMDAGTAFIQSWENVKAGLQGVQSVW